MRFQNCIISTLLNAYFIVLCELHKWKLVKSIKMDALKRCEHDGWWTTFDDDGEIDGEGYVMWNRWGIYKLVNRNQFSRLNFLTNNNWVSS